MIIGRATNRFQKNTLNYIKSHGLSDMDMALVGKPDGRISFKDFCIVFGTLKERTKAGNFQESTLFYDKRNEKWCAATFEEHLDAVAEWEWSEEAIGKLQMAVFAASGLSDSEISKKLRLKKGDLASMTSDDNRQISGKNALKIHEYTNFA